MAKRGVLSGAEVDEHPENSFISWGRGFLGEGGIGKAMSRALDLLRSTSNSFFPHHSDSEWWALNKPFVLKLKPVLPSVWLWPLGLSELLPHWGPATAGSGHPNTAGTIQAPRHFLERWSCGFDPDRDQETIDIGSSAFRLNSVCCETLTQNGTKRWQPLWHCVGRVEFCQRLRCRWQTLTRPEFECLVSECQRGLAGVDVRPLAAG